MTSSAQPQTSIHNTQLHNPHNLKAKVGFNMVMYWFEHGGPPFTNLMFLRSKLRAYTLASASDKVWEFSLSKFSHLNILHIALTAVIEVYQPCLEIVVLDKHFQYGCYVCLSTFEPTWTS